jgi:DNA-binding CsgD family transcriptional regulator
MQTTHETSRKRALAPASFAQTNPILPPLPAGKLVLQRSEEVKRSLHLVEKLFPAWIIVLRDEQHGIRFMSDNCAAFLGVSPQDAQAKHCSDLLDRIHPEDLEAFARIRQKIDELLKNLPPGQVHDYRFVLNYRCHAPDGRYRLIHEEKLYVANGQGHYNVFMVLRDITGEKPFTRVFLEWYKCLEGAYRRLGTYVPAIDNAADPSPITQREVEIIQLLKEGLSSKEIASRLFISINTVRNHRSNLFKKTNARNVVELLRRIPSDHLLSA